MGVDQDVIQGTAFHTWKKKISLCWKQSSDKLTFSKTQPDVSLYIFYRAWLANVEERRTSVQEVGGSSPRPDQHTRT